MWLKRCHVRHPDCSKANDREGQLPTRGIAVGSGSQEPYLYISNGESGRFAALSHCWGQRLTLTTTMDTLEERKKWIPFPIIPKSYQDAILIARGLGLKYLWIDSLCILQNDGNDWEEQSRQMADIYSNAEIIIAASEGADSSEGCLKPRELPWRVRPLPSDRAETAREMEQVLLAYLRPSFLSAILSARLNTRAWCLQELALSRRTLHCTNAGLYWQCGSGVASEDGLETTFGRKPTGLGADNLFNLPSDRRRDSSHAWRVMVTNYSTRQLSFKSDKLAAMLGLTRYFSEWINDQPVFGLWKKDLHYGLLWRCGSSEMRKPAELSSIPSWSWTSLDVPIHMPLTKEEGDETTNRAVIESSDHSNEEQNLTSSSSGSRQLTITGRLIRAQCPGSSKSTIINVTGPAPEYASLTSFHEEIKEVSIGWCTFDTLPYGTEQTVLCLEISMTDWQADPDPNYPLTRESELRTNDIHQTHSCLILEEDDGGINQYRRIGIGLIDPTIGEFDNVEMSRLILV